MHTESIQANGVRADGTTRIMQSKVVERRRTVVALLSASVISIVVWGLVVALNVH
jgi:hypothetical protein